MTGKRRAEPPKGGRPEQRSGAGAAPTSSGQASTPQRQVAGAVIAPMQSRRDERRRRQRRQRLVGLGVVGVIVLAAVVVVLIRQLGGSGGPSQSTAGSDLQTTVLLQVRNASGGSTGGVLLAHDERLGSGVELLVPSTLIVSTCGLGQQDFGQLVSDAGGATTAATTLGATLGGVHVDGAWTLTQPQLSKLVDAVGGIDIDVDTPVTQPGPGGTTRILVQRGRQHLAGSQAVAYAAFHAGGAEAAAAQLARLQSVVQATIDRLPHDSSAVQRIVTGLGRGAASSLGAAKLASLLLSLSADDARNGGVLATDLPVIRLATSGSPSYRVDAKPLQQLVSTNFADSLPAHPMAPVKVQVENGVGTPGLVPHACGELQTAGFTPVDGGNATFSDAPSQVLVGARTVVDAQLGRRVATALHLPATDVAVDPVGQTVAQVLVVLGKDYQGG